MFFWLQLKQSTLRYIVKSSRPEPPLRKEVMLMAKTEDGKKKVYVHPYTRPDGTKVKTHYRSTPN